MDSSNGVSRNTVSDGEMGNSNQCALTWIYPVKVVQVRADRSLSVVPCKYSLIWDAEFVITPVPSKIERPHFDATGQDGSGTEPSPRRRYVFGRFTKKLLADAGILDEVTDQCFIMSRSVDHL